MLTLEEAIKHAEYIVNNRKDAISVCWSVRECEQIAAWLRELQERRKAPEIVRCGECKQKSFCPSKIDCGNGLDYIIDFCSNGKKAERRTE